MSATFFLKFIAAKTLLRHFKKAVKSQFHKVVKQKHLKFVTRSRLDEHKFWQPPKVCFSSGSQRRQCRVFRVSAVWRRYTHWRRRHSTFHCFRCCSKVIILKIVDSNGQTIIFNYSSARGSLTCRIEKWKYRQKKLFSLQTIHTYIRLSCTVLFDCASALLQVTRPHWFIAIYARSLFGLYTLVALWECTKIIIIKKI